MEAIEREVRRAFEGAAGARRPRPHRKFNADDGYISYGLAVPTQRRIWRQFRSRFAALTLSQRLDLAAGLLTAHIGELGHAGIYVLGLSAGELGPKQVPKLDKMLDAFRGWSHVDHFCGSVMQPLLAGEPEEVVALCRRWSRSLNRWKRRASVVTFTRKVGESGAYTDEVLELCDSLIWDREDLVQKGVGWALKDNLRSAPGRIVPYIKGLRRGGVPSTVTLYAIRDLPAPKRREILAVKRAHSSRR